MNSSGSPALVDFLNSPVSPALVDFVARTDAPVQHTSTYSVFLIPSMTPSLSGGTSNNKIVYGTCLFIYLHSDECTSKPTRSTKSFNVPIVNIK